LSWQTAYQTGVPLKLLNKHAVADVCNLGRHKVPPTFRKWYEMSGGLGSTNTVVGKWARPGTLKVLGSPPGLSGSSDRDRVIRPGLNSPKDLYFRNTRRLVRTSALQSLASRLPMDDSGAVVLRERLTVGMRHDLSRLRRKVPEEERQVLLRQNEIGPKTNAINRVVRKRASGERDTANRCDSSIIFSVDC
jgi:hypothetical protein